MPHSPAIRPGEVDNRKDSEDLQRKVEEPRDRLSRLSRARLSIAGDLDLDTVLQETVNGSRSLTGAPYVVLTVLDDSEQMELLELYVLGDLAIDSGHRLQRRQQLTVLARTSRRRC